VATFSLSDVLKEARRRRVFRVAALYIVGAWAILQVSDLAFVSWNIPSQALRHIWIGAVIGFPLAIVFGWRYDIVDGRIARTAASDLDADMSIGRTDYIILAALAFVTAVIILGSVTEISNTHVTDTAPVVVTKIDPKSIAVLPFENMSGDKSNDPFTIGIHDDLLTHISKISDIKVISRTSVARLDTSMSIPDIGQLLSVAVVMEGGVQRIVNRVRINAQLIDAVSDQHLWADTFDRELTTQNIFEIQSEIAAIITDNLQATLSPQDVVNLDKVPTKNLEAYEAYLLGKQHLATRTRADLLKARDFFSEAIDLDKQYALAYAGLADANLLLYYYGAQSLSEALALAEPAIDSALALDNQLGAVYASLGLSRFYQLDFASAETAFKHAIALDPNNAKTYHWFGDMLATRLRQPEAAIPLLERARELDPLSSVISITLGEALEGVGRFGEAMALYRKTIEIDSDYPAAYFLLGFHYRAVLGQLDDALRLHHQEIAVDPVRDNGNLGLIYLELGDDAKAEYWIDRALRINPGWFNTNAAKIRLHWYRGQEVQALQVARQLLSIVPANNVSLLMFVSYGQYQEALDKVAPGYPDLSCDVDPTVTRINLFQAINLSLALEETGEHECADRLLEKSLERLQGMPRLGLFGYGIADIEILARQGNTTQALDTLRLALDEGFRSPSWWASVEGNPHMVSLRGEPEFKEMIAEIRAEMAAQLSNVREMEANGELSQFPDSLQ